DDALSTTANFLQQFVIAELHHPGPAGAIERSIPLLFQRTQRCFEQASTAGLLRRSEKNRRATFAANSTSGCYSHCLLIDPLNRIMHEILFRVTRATPQSD